MEIKQLKNRPDLTNGERTNKQYEKLKKILAELRLKDLSEVIIVQLNSQIERLNNFEGSEKQLGKEIRKTQAAILRLLEKEAGIVTKNYYRNKWLAIGIAAFGIPMGVGFGAALNNMSFLAIGLPVGMSIGIAVGSKKDQEAAAQGKVLDIEI